MSPSVPSLRRLLPFLVLVGLGVVLVTRVPTVSVAGTTVTTGFAVGLLAAVLMVPAIASHWRSGESRQALRWSLFAVGIPLSLLQVPALAWLGVLGVVASLAVGWEVDRRLGLTAS